MAEPSYPNCAASCISTALAAAGCPTADSSCPCTSDTDAFKKNFTPCIAKSCSKSDVNSLYNVFLTILSRERCLLTKSEVDELWSDYCASLKKNEVLTAFLSSTSATAVAPVTDKLTISPAPAVMLTPPVSQRPIQASPAVPVHTPTISNPEPDSKTLFPSTAAAFNSAHAATLLLQSQRPPATGSLDTSNITRLSNPTVTPKPKSNSSQRSSSSLASSQFVPTASVFSSSIAIPQSRPTLSTAVVAILGTSAGVAVLLLFILPFFCISRHRRTKRALKVAEKSPVIIPPSHSVKGLRYEDFKETTNSHRRMPQTERNFIIEGTYELEAVEIKSNLASPSDSIPPQCSEWANETVTCPREEDMDVKIGEKEVSFPIWVEMEPGKIARPLPPTPVRK